MNFTDNQKNPDFTSRGLKNLIVFQCYGNKAIFHECTYALLSLSRLYDCGALNNTEIWIYTDNPGWFDSFSDCQLPLNFRELSKETITQWRGKIDFVHRVKIEMLKDFTGQKTGNVLYCDTDVVFTHCIDDLLTQITAGQLFMHTAEGRVSEEGNPILKKLNKYLVANTDIKINGQPINELVMWNAGVLGFNTQYTAALDKVLDFTDQQYPRFPKHIVEQFAFSAFLQEAAPIHAASPYLVHYWNLKEARQLLQAFFTAYKGAAWPDLAQRSLQLQMPVLMQEKANFYQNRSIADKLRKKNWQPANIDWQQ